MMIQLKIKALKSVLDANQHGDDENTKSNKKAKRFKKRSKLVNAPTSDSDDGNNGLKKSKMNSQKNKFKHKLIKRSKNLFKIYILLKN